MRILGSLFLLLAATAGCDDGDGDSVDAPSPVGPRVIPGGGIGDGPIDGVAYVHVVDDITRMPVSGATVRVGSIEGTTDAAGLFTAEGVTGPQTVVVKAATYRSEMIVGANGTNITTSVEPAAKLTPQSATITGSVDLSSFSVPIGHTKFAALVYSQTEYLGDPANEIPSPNPPWCVTGISTTQPNNNPCNFTIEVRTGKVALLASVLDINLNGTPLNPDDDIRTLIGYAYKTGLVVAANVDQSNVTLGALDIGMQHTVSVDFGSPPPGHNTVAGIMGLATDDGIFQFAPRTPTESSLLIPKPGAFGTGSYQLVGIAATSNQPTATQSIVLRRGQAASPLAAGAWLAAPTSTAITRTTASWGAVSGATFHSVEYAQGNARLLNVAVLDGTTQFTIPDLVALPAGAIQVKVNAIGAPGLDLMDFEGDRDEDKLQMVGLQPVDLP